MQLASQVAYVAGPFRNPSPYQQEKNIRAAEEVSLELMRRGIANICPHTLGRFYDKEVPDEIILPAMQALMLKCEVVVCIPGWLFSKGTLSEVELAKRVDMRVYYLDKESIDSVASEILNSRTRIVNTSDLQER